MRTILYLLFFLCSIILSAQDWQTSYLNAISKAKEEHKNVVLVFSGSDWCAPCIKLDKEIWRSKAFKQYSEDNYILYKADFPRKKKNAIPKEVATTNIALVEKYNPKSFFPLVVILDENEKVLGTTGYKKIAPLAYISLLKSFEK